MMDSKLGIKGLEEAVDDGIKIQPEKRIVGLTDLISTYGRPLSMSTFKSNTIFKIICMCLSVETNEHSHFSMVEKPMTVNKNRKLDLDLAVTIPRKF